MGKINYRPVFNRSNKLNANGKALVQVEAYLSGKKIYFSTLIYLLPCQWNANKRKIVKHPEAETLNYFLQDFIMKLERKEMELWRIGGEVSLEALKREVKPRKKGAFLQFIEEEITSSRSKESTRTNLKTTWNLLRKYNPLLNYPDVTPHFIHAFEKHLHGKRFATNTVAKHLKHLKTFVNLAIDKGYMDANDYPFRRYRIKTGECKHTFLMPEEMEKLEELSSKGCTQEVEHVLDAFLFCCYTGLRYSDFVNLKEDNIVLIDGQEWMVFRTVKTGIEVKLPLYLLFEGKALKMLGKYQGHLNAFFALKSNTLVNYMLKTVGKLAGIDKHFSFHSARHTNATLLIYKGANITTVQKLLGHRNIATTQIYSEVMAQTVVKDLAKIRAMH